MDHGKHEMSKGERFLQWWDKHYKVVMITMGVLAVLSVSLAVALTLWMRLPEVPVTTRPSLSGSTDAGSTGTDTKPNVDEVVSDRREGVYTFLVVGRDVAVGLTDTMMLITYDTVNTTIDALSLPRDTMVNVPTSYKKLNGVYNLNKGKDKATQVENGITALKSEVEGLTGIYPDFYVMVDWDAVGNLVNAIGGVWFDVPYNMNYDDPAQGLSIHQKKGYRLLNGDDAMQVIRHRKNNDGSYSVGDVGRMAVQQDFLMAVAKQCLTPAMILKAPDLVNIFLEQVTTDLTVGNLLAFAQKASGINVGEDVNFVTMPYTDYYRYTSYALPVGEELLTIINDDFNPYVDALTMDDLNILYVSGSAGRLSVTSGQLEDSSLADAVIYPVVEKDDEEDKDDEENQEAESGDSEIDDGEVDDQEITPDDSRVDVPADSEGELPTAPETTEPPVTEPEGENFPQPDPNLPDVTEQPQGEMDTSEEVVDEDPAILEPIPSIESTQNNEQTI